MKVRLMTGDDPILVPPAIEKRDIFPPEVTNIAKQHWLDMTIPEPAVERRMKRKERRLETGERAPETGVTRWQHLTTKEQYASFKEECKETVREVMANKANTERAKLVGRPDSEDKRRRLERCETLSQCFPGVSWYLGQKPSEVKPLVDHTTGLCRYCEQAGLNYQTLVRTVRRQCGCGTSQCPHWTCLCIPDEFEDEEMGIGMLCTCKCSCDNCRSCEVLHHLCL